MSKEYQGFKIAVVGKDHAEIEVSGIIAGWDFEKNKPKNTIQELQVELNKLKELNVKSIVVKVMGCLGGDFNHAIMIHDALVDHPAEVDTLGTGMIASGGTHIFLSGKNRKISKNSLFLIHKCLSGIYGNENDIQAELEAQNQVNNRQVSLYKEYSSLNEDEIRDLMNANNGNGKWISSDEVRKAGFATEVYNETAKAAFKYDKKIFTSFGYPEVPEGSEFSAETETLSVFQEIKQSINELKNTVIDSFKANKNNNQQTEVPMKKLFAVFPLLCAILAIQNKEEEFDETTGRVLTNDEMNLVEAQISELNALKAEKTAWESEKNTLNTSVTSITAERDSFKAKYENTPAFKGETNADDKNEDTYAAKQKENPMYAGIKEEFGIE